MNTGFFSRISLGAFVGRNTAHARTFVHGLKFTNRFLVGVATSSLVLGGVLVREIINLRAQPVWSGTISTEGVLDLAGRANNVIVSGWTSEDLLFSTVPLRTKRAVNVIALVKPAWRRGDAISALVFGIPSATLTTYATSHGLHFVSMPQTRVIGPLGKATLLALEASHAHVDKDTTFLQATTVVSERRLWILVILYSLCGIICTLIILGRSKKKIEDY